METYAHNKSLSKGKNFLYLLTSAQSVVVITGASSGIGKALALEYSKRRCRLVLAARSTNKLQEIAQQCTANGSTVLVVPTDVSQMGQCKTLINKTMKKFGEIDLLVLNAGVSMHVPFDELEEKEMSKVFHDLMEVVVHFQHLH